MSDWYVGQKVVCVNAHVRCGQLVKSGSLTEGTIYIVRGIFPWKDHVLLYVEGIYAYDWRPGIEYGFFSGRFRPLVSQSLDISVFERLLDPLKTREVVDA